MCDLYFHLTHDHDHGLSRSNFETAVSQESEDRLTEDEKDVSRWDIGSTVWPWAVTLRALWASDFRKDCSV